MMKLLQYSIELYPMLEVETGQPVDYHRCGSVRLATSGERLDEFHHRKGIADTLGIPFEIVSPDRAQELFPLLELDGVLGAAYIPSDGHVDPSGVAQAFAKGAQSRGARISRHTVVTGIERSGSAWLVRNVAGAISGRRSSSTPPANGRAPSVSSSASISPSFRSSIIFSSPRPSQRCETWISSSLYFGIAIASFYVRREVDALIVGPFEPETKPWGLDGIPDDFHGRLLEPALDRLEGVLEAAAKRVPVFADAGIKTIVNGPDGYTPDGRCLMGPVPGLPDFHVLAGFSIFGIVFRRWGGGSTRPNGSSTDNRVTTCGKWDVSPFSANTAARRATSPRRAVEVLWG